MASLLNRLIKFRRGGDQVYEDLQGTDQPGTVSPVQGPPSSSVQGEKEDEFTVDQAVDRIGFGKFQIKLSFLTGLAWMADAMEMMILSILSPALHCAWGLPSFQQALLTTVVFAGMMVSSGIWGKCADKYGRRAELVICSVFTFYFGFLSAFSPTFVWMLLLRFLVGFGIGGVPQSVTLYSEFLPSTARAKCIVMIELFWGIGACFVVLLAIVVMSSGGFRWLLALTSLPLLVFTAACVVTSRLKYVAAECWTLQWLPESARYDMTRGNQAAAQATLERIASDNGKAMPLGRLVDSAKQATVNGQEVQRGQIKDLFTPELRVTTCLLWFIWLITAFAYYGIVLMTTELFQIDDDCHGNGKSGHRRRYFSTFLGGTGSKPDVICSVECRELTTKDYVDLLWTTVAEFPGLFITVLIIEWMGRKKTMAIEFLVFSLFVFLLNICTTRTILTLFLFVARAFISGAFQAAYVYTPEVYPTTTRAIGLGACSGMARIGALITPFVAQVMLKKTVTGTICMYGSCCVIAAVAAMFLPIETKGREMKDTHQDLNIPLEAKKLATISSH